MGDGTVRHSIPQLMQKCRLRNKFRDAGPSACHAFLTLGLAEKQVSLLFNSHTTWVPR